MLLLGGAGRWGLEGEGEGDLDAGKLPELMAECEKASFLGCSAPASGISVNRESRIMKPFIVSWLGLGLIVCVAGLGCSGKSGEDPAPVECESGETDCSGRCADLTKDTGNCGECGLACPQGQTCQDGLCATQPVCAYGDVVCEGECANLEYDSKHCGQCGIECGLGQNCQNRFCAAAPVCAAPQVACGATCVDLTSSTSHCGKCGTRCTVGKTCEAGVCTASQSCAAGFSVCNGGCANYQTDNANCGLCQNACPSGTTCQAGTCAAAPSCAEGQTACGALCTDIDTDPSNCGQCNTACPSGSSCVAGACVTAGTCPEGQVSCSGRCVDLQTDLLHCGVCDHACTGETNCQGGLCQEKPSCGTGQTACGAECFNLNGDSNNCGSCGKVCPTGQNCQNGSCTDAPECEAGKTPCGSACIDTSADNNNCGGCGQPCSNGQTCVQGVCTSSTTTCGENETSCAGTCVTLASDNAHCGECNRVCGAGTSCQGGECVCATGVDCDGTCVDTNTDDANCGGCGEACPTGSTCAEGLCVCSEGRADCGGQCVDTDSDPAHCGQCDQACGEDLLCSAGECAEGCAEGLTECGASCVDTATHEEHCGGCDQACDAGLECTAGECACAEGETSCAGTCVDTQTDSAHCGDCDQACGGGAVCEGGECACPEGQLLCGSACYEGTECPDLGCVQSPGVVSNFEDQLLTLIDQPGENWTGEWEAFNDGAGTQTLTIEEVGTEECQQYALHTTGSGFSSYVGIGFTFRGTGEDPEPYDGSAWTGLRFRARLGDAATTPVRVNISTPWSEATDSGGSCTSGGTPDTECYNHVGRFLHEENELGTEWREYTFCFDRDLYPLFVPSNLTNEQRQQIAGNLLKVQFQFNQAKNLPDQPDPNTTYEKHPASTAFDFWVDDVELVAEPCAEPEFASSSGTAHPFPQNGNLGSCAPATDAEIFTGAIVRLYEHWKEHLVVEEGGGKRVKMPEQNNMTASEAQGYGMIIAAVMGDKELFDGLWTYTEDKLEGTGLMQWRTDGSGSATDADEDIAFALLLGDMQWGGTTYSSTAGDMIAAMATHDVEDGTITPGSNWNDTDAYNPSYFAPSFYRVFDAAVGDNTWAGVIDAGYTTLENNQTQFQAGGLISDWCTVDGTAVNGQTAFNATVTGNFTEGPVYGYDAARVPWRLGLDACVNDDPDAKARLTALLSFFANEYEDGDKIDTLLAGWYAGHVASNAAESQVSFIGPVGVGAMAIAGRDNMRDRAFRSVLDIMENPEFNRTYYPATLGLITLLTMTGNFPHP